MISWILVALCLPVFAFAKIVYLFPTDPEDVKVEVEQTHLCRVGVHRSFWQLKAKLAQRGIDLKIADIASYQKKQSWLGKWLNRIGIRSTIDEPDVECYLVWNWVCAHRKEKEALARLPKEKLVLFLWEPATTDPLLYKPEFHNLFSKIYTWDDQLVDNQRYFKFFYPVLEKMDIPPIPFAEKKLCTMIVTNKQSKHPNELYTARQKLIWFFEKQPDDDFDFYGAGWGGGWRNYKGPIAVKQDVMKRYRFCICYENICQLKGYISEKIFDCFAAGCVPVYWGASNIADYIPADCYISRTDFETDEQLYHYLKSMPEAQHQAYLDRIQRYLSSEQAQLFSPDHLVDLCLEAIH